MVRYGCQEIFKLQIGKAYYNMDGSIGDYTISIILFRLL